MVKKIKARKKSTYDLVINITFPSWLKWARKFIQIELVKINHYTDGTTITKKTIYSASEDGKNKF